jgi:hypothetical protein
LILQERTSVYNQSGFDKQGSIGNKAHAGCLVDFLMTIMKQKSVSVWYRSAVLAGCLLVAPALFAAQMAGTVVNGTTEKPGLGEEVVLLSAGNTNEISRTRADNQGHFALNVPDDGTEHLLRVTRQSVDYFAPVPPGAANATLTVYDAATQITNVFEEARVYRLQASGGELDVNEAYTIRNDSQPSRSKIGNQTFAITLPDGAELGAASIARDGGKSIPVSPVPSGAKNRYAFDFPIQPGVTRFEVIYKLPYTGSHEFSLTPENTLSELGVLLPKSMKFTAANGNFSQDRDEEGMNVFFTKNAAANQEIKFQVSGQGLASQSGESSNQGSQTSPEGSSSGTHGNAWLYVLGIAAVILITGAAIWMRRKSAANKSSTSAVTSGKKAKPNVPQDPHPGDSDGDMLKVLKDELFQLETDRLDGKISHEEYEKTKAGLDTLFRRQMKKMAK